MTTPAGDPRRFLIVGGAGFVGAHLTRRLVAQGQSVTVLLRPSTVAARLSDMEGKITLHRQSTSDRSGLRACFAHARSDVVFYLAGRTADRHVHAVKDAHLAAEGTAALLAVLEAAAEAQVPPHTFIRTGTIAEYGKTRYPFREDQREAPDNGYALAAVSGTHLAQVLAPHLPFALITARLSLVYGLHQASDFLVPGLVEACLARRRFTINRPHDRRDLLHVDDIVDALLVLARADLASGTIVNIGSAEPVSVADVARQVLAIAGADPALLDARPQDDPVTLLLSTERMEALTGWKRGIGLHEGLTALINQKRGGTALRNAAVAA